jgi:DNA-binding HxlR family transcriptional regulator
MALMTSKASATTVETTPGLAPGPDGHGEIDRAFRDFRESAVRLAERVNDLAALDVDPVTAARGDLHLMRSIFSKWSTDVLVALHAVPSVGFEELRRSLTGISPRVLSLKLKELEHNGMVHREIIDARPPRVRYALTDRGWTVAWLAQPVLLFLRFSEESRRSRTTRPEPLDDPDQ